MLESGRKGRKFALVCLTLSYSAVHCRVIIWIFENLKNWQSHEHYRNYTLYFEGYFPYIWNYSPVFELTCFLEYIGMMCATFPNTGTDAFFSQLIYHFIGEYKILRLNLLDLVRNFKNNMSESEYNDKFRDIILQHCHINRSILFLFLPIIV